MVDLVIVGSLGIDDIKTPFGSTKNVIGGSLSYASLVSNLFADVGVVAVVGNDFSKENMKIFEDKGIDLKGLKKRKGKTFRWKGHYDNTLSAHTDHVDLGVFENFNPQIPKEYKDAEYLMLGCIDPEIQLQVLNQIPDAFTIVDTRDIYIENNLDDLIEVFKKSDIVLMNDDESELLTDTVNAVSAGKNILGMGAENVIIKKGANGAIAFLEEDIFVIPAYPTDNVKDPTGAGDSFAAGLLGYLSKVKKDSKENIRKALAYGTVSASFAVEEIGIKRVKTLTEQEIRERLSEFEEIVRF